MSIIRTPFNFVPLSDKVFSPDWANIISQDIPFADGLSGTIGLTITAESPIFVRNGHTKQDAEEKNEEYLSFSHVNGADGKPLYFIPATTIKGEVRTLLEIMSFSKMTVDDKARFARRDLNDKAIYPLMEHQKEIHCGWMKRKTDESGYTITDCGRPMRISQPDIDEYAGNDILKRNFSEKMVHDKLKDEHKSATYKYQLLKGIPLEGLHFTDKQIDRQDGAFCVKYDSQGDIKGTIVLTGQPGLWKEVAGPKRGKYYEFVFSDESYGKRELSNEEFDEYAFIYQNSDDWERVKRLLDEKDGKGAPVFFRIDNRDDNKVKDFGLAYLYKLPYKNTVYNSLPAAHRKATVDLAQCIFGYIDPYGKNSLKGRVHFGNASAKPETVDTLPLVKLPLGSPKASYLPIYIHQEGGSGGQLPVAGRDKKGKPKYLYKSYDTGTPSGWKRYYQRDNNTWGKPAEENSKGKDTQNTLFIPLKEGAVFTGTIAFHNLRPVELGALLCALEFAGVPGCRHQLGQAKPYGYGRCKYEVSLKAIKLTKDIHTPQEEITSDDTRFIDLFKKKMTEELKGEWQNQKPIEMLLASALCTVPNTPEFQYMTMSNNRDDNEFLQAKKQGLYLRSIDELTQMKDYKKQMLAQQRPAELKRIEAEWRGRLDKAAADPRQLPLLSALSSTILDELNKPGLEDDVKPILEKIKAECDERIREILVTPPPPQPTDFQGFLPHATSYQQWEGRIAKWLKEEKHTSLTPQEQDYALEKLKEAYDRTSSSKADKRNWKTGGTYYKKCSKLIGEELTRKWFAQLVSPINP